ncbi:flagellar basal-body MS-ring/collar protein FliF [Kangiella sp. HZ709]|uniref:flagellar basal-body MS-ring/collar protein FliF n=1 Tax=Kangiella sp. HZ709 TaxID=2666328 RepID=UPI0012AFDC4F|nr:flagellar basal-body MS-ring/collar protein FliF [Kangiella sp. HZ709]MRX26850.1 flagellar M-ring protein FliF [Kangiella sp. HZ709]
MFNNLKKEHVIIAFSIAFIAIVGFYFWQSTNSWVALTDNADEIESAKIIKSLEELKVEHKVSPDGTVMVKASEKANTRLKLTSEKVLVSEAVGLEIFDNLDYGMTEFSQKVHYQRALQGELSRSIKNIDGIKYARVHLSTPEKRLFKNDQRKATAAVAIAGTDISNIKLNSIKELVAASIDNLEPADVIITDTKGTVFNSKADVGSNVSGKLEQKQMHESAIENKISTILNLIIEPTQYELSVNVELNFNKIKETNNDFISPSKEIILKKSTSTGNKKTNNQNIEYGYGTKIESIEHSTGEIKRISAGIILTKSMSDAAIQKLNQVILDAIGINKERGDSLTVVVFDKLEDGLAIGTTQNTVTKDNADKVVTSSDLQVIKPSLPVKVLKEDVSKVAINEQPKINSLLEHPYLKKEYLVIALGLSLFLLLISLLFRRNQKLNNYQREKLLTDVQNWLKE